SDDDQTVLGYRLTVQPSAPATAYRDGFGNRVDMFNLLLPCQEVVIRATSYVRTHRRPVAARLAGAELSNWAALEAIEFLQPSPLVARSAQLEESVAQLPPAHASVQGELEQLSEAVRKRLRYEKKVTTARTPVAEALRLGCGVCQDFA